MRTLAVLLWLAAALPSAAVAASPSNDEILRRLDALAKENAALRARVNRLEAERGRPQAVVEKASPTALPTHKSSGPIAEPESAPPFSWSGAHIGILSGASLLEPTGPLGAPDGVPLLGGLVGAAAGYDWQRDGLVFGIEGDYGRIFSNIDVLDSAVSPAPHGGQFVFGNYYRPDSFATLRVRAGVAVDRALIYGTIGVGAVHGQQSASLGDLDVYLKKPEWATGLALGGGVEYVLSDHWTVGVEALYLEAPQESMSYCCVSGNPSTFFINPSALFVKASADYKF